uniref:CDP-L-ribitol pyrophosphorylase A n=1 Tax=Neogobius melanostomus TaxID=47308 RepID=A0A8C6U469_9GOBI
MERPADPGASLARLPGKDPHNNPGDVSVDFPVSVVLPAGGTGERTGLQTPKQFCGLMGRPLISYTAQAFERVSWIQCVVVVVATESLALMRDIAQRYRHSKVRVVPGGSTRHRSIRRGVQALREPEEQVGAGTPKVVIIHDAVRPFVDEDMLSKIAMAAKEHGAAGAIRPLVSTVIATTSEGYLDHSLERAKYRASEMPQGFTYEVIHQAYQKVTYKRDLAAAESIIKESLSQSSCVLTGDCPSALSLAASLQKAFTTQHMDLDIIPNLQGDHANYLLKEWNFIQISVNGSLSEVKALLASLQAAERALLNPVVVVWVHLSGADLPSIGETATEPAAISDLASPRLENWKTFCCTVSTSGSVRTQRAGSSQCYVSPKSPQP